MFLFVDTLSDPCALILFDEKRIIVDQEMWHGQRQEFDTLIEKIDDLVTKNNIEYRDLNWIISIIGPGGFTGTRVSSLVVNSLAFAFNISLFPITVWEFFALQNAPLPWITALTKKDVLLWNSWDTDDFTIAPITELGKEHYSSITMIDFGDTGATIEKAGDYPAVIQHLRLEKGQSRIHPIYARDPNITLKK